MGDPAAEFQTEMGEYGAERISFITNLVTNLEGNTLLHVDSPNFATEKCQEGLDTEEKRKMTAKLFFRVYQKVIASEQKRLGDLWEKRKEAVLSSKQLVTLLYACCTLVVLHGNSLDSYYNRANNSNSNNNNDKAQSVTTFPWVLVVLGIQPFDFPKIIDCIIKEEPTVRARVDTVTDVYFLVPGFFVEALDVDRRIHLRETCLATNLAHFFFRDLHVRMIH